jgi:hypothetical protein
VFCNDVHTNVKSLERYIAVDEDKIINAIDCLPKKDNIPRILLTIVVFTVQVLENTGKLFNLDTKEIQSMEDRFKTILHLYKK